MFKVVDGVVSDIKSDTRYLIMEDSQRASKDSKPDRGLTSLSENGYM